MSVADTVIETQDLVREYRTGSVAVRALDGVSLSITAGSFVALVGASGSGKTTLLSLLGCLDSPTSGSYCLEGRSVHELSVAELARVRNRRIGFIFQAFNLLPRLRADENVALPLRYAGIGRKARVKRAREMLDRVGLGDRIDHRPDQLSGGQRQRVAVARALVTDPAILLADEPTGNLDSASSAEILGLLRGLNEDGRTVVLVTHDDEIAAAAPRCVRLRDGRVLSDELRA